MWLMEIYNLYLKSFSLLSNILAIIVIILIIIILVNKNQIYSTYPMFIYVELAFGGHCLHFPVYTINSAI